MMEDVCWKVGRLESRMVGKQRCGFMFNMGVFDLCWLSGLCWKDAVGSLVMGVLDAVWCFFGGIGMVAKGCFDICRATNQGQRQRRLAFSPEAGSLFRP